LGYFLLVSRYDDTTPFRVFVSKHNAKKRSAVSEAPSDPVVTVKGVSDLQRLCASNEGGYLSIPLFKYIRDHFRKW